MLNFVGIERKNGMVIIDGYTTCKYRKNALKDVAKAIRPMDAAEADVIIDALANGENPEVANVDSESYCLTLEPVGCATLYNEEMDEMEYAEANYYFMIRFTDREAEKEEKEMANMMTVEAKRDMMYGVVFDEIAATYDMGKLRDMDRWNGLSKMEMLEWLLDRKSAIDTLITGLYGVGLLPCVDDMRQMNRDRYLQACKAVKTAVQPSADGMMTLMVARLRTAVQAAGTLDMSEWLCLVDRIETEIKRAERDGQDYLVSQLKGLHRDLMDANVDIDDIA